MPPAMQIGLVTMAVVAAAIHSLGHGRLVVDAECSSRLGSNFHLCMRSAVVVLS
jgi:hypothetical protein